MDFPTLTKILHDISKILALSIFFVFPIPLNIPLKKTRDKLLEISYGKILGYICNEEALTFRNSKNSWKRYAAKTKEDYPLPLCRVGRTLNQLAKWEPL